MALRAQIFERFQLGPEVTPGVPVLPTRRPLGLGLSFDPQIDSAVIKEMGNKAPVGMQVFKEHTEGNFTGDFGFNELLLVLSSIFGKAVITTPVSNGVWAVAVDATGGTFTAKLGTFPTSAAIDIATLTASAFQTALALVLGTGNVTVTGSNSAGYLLTLNNYLKRYNGLLVIDDALATGAGASVDATTTAGTLSRLWTFKPNHFDPDDVQTYTFAQGSSNQGARASGGLFRSMSWEARPKETITLSGNILAALYQQGYVVQNLVFNTGTTGGTFKATYKTIEGPSITYSGALTAATVKAALEAISSVGVGNVEVIGANGGAFAVALVGDLWDDDAEGFTVTSAALTGGSSPGASFKFPLSGLTLTNIKTVPVESRNIGLWMGDSFATMTQLSKCQGIRNDVGERAAPVFMLDDRIRSYSGTVEESGDPTFTITVEQNSTADNYIQKMRRNEVVYVRVAAEGPVIESGYRYRMEAIFACNIREPNAAEVDGVHSGTYVLQCIYDETLDTYIQWTIQSPLTGL